MNCRCDEELAYTLNELAPTVYNNDFHDFDHGKCKVSTGSSGNGGGNGDVGNDNADDKIECCGIYPNRFDFLTQGGARSCCHDVTYNPNQHSCCDRSVKAFGSC